MNFKWPSEGTSVVLLPHGEVGASVFALAEAWTQHGLLMPALYVPVENQDERAYRPFSNTGPIKISAFVAGRNGHRAVELFDELARNEISLVRVLACRIVDTSSSFHELQDRMVDRVREQIEISAPLSEKDGKHLVGTNILRLNLIAGESAKVEGSAEHLLELDWDANIIVSPEDRATPAGFDTFTDSSDPRYIGFLLSNIASTTGIWSGVNKSVIELQHIEGSSAFDKVLVQRTFGRIVKTDTLAIRLAAATLKTIEVQGSPLKDPTYSLNEKKKLTDVETSEAIAYLVEETLKADNGALAFGLSLERAKADGIKKVSFREGLKILVKYFIEKITSLPRHLIEIIIETFNRKATGLIFGEDTGYAVEVRKDFRKFGLQERDAEDLIKLDDVKKLITANLNDLSKNPGYAHEHPELWSRIRKMLVSVLEGDLDEYKGKVLVDTENLIPKYGHSWTVPECVLDPEEDPEEIKSSLEWLDVALATKIATSLTDEVDFSRGEVFDLQKELLVAEKERDISKSNARDIRRTKEKLSARNHALALILEGIDHDV